MFNYSKLPVSVQDGMKRYIEHGIKPGGFLEAVLKNDLKGAVTKADDTNIKELTNIVLWIHWEIPSGSCGSELKVKSWMDSHKPVEERRYMNDYIRS